MRELDEVAAVEWQFHNLGAVDDAAERGVIRLQLQTARFHRDGLGYFTDFELQIEPRDLLDLQDDLVELLRLEAGRGSSDGLLARGQER